MPLGAARCGVASRNATEEGGDQDKQRQRAGERAPIGGAECGKEASLHN
jgi:hypothetical protein